MASPNNLPPEPVRIAYDHTPGRRRWAHNKQRLIKVLPDMYSARRFWTKMFNAGRNPKIIGSDMNSTIATTVDANSGRYPRSGLTMQDIAYPAVGVDVQFDAKKMILHVNMDGFCILRIEHIPYFELNGCGKRLVLQEPHHGKATTQEKIQKGDKAKKGKTK